MAKVTEKRRAELTQQLPPQKVTQRRVREYMQMADLPMKQFGELIGYSGHTLTKFLNGRYSDAENSDLLIREACELAMQRHPVGAKTATTNGDMYETENTREIRRLFNHCHEHQALAFVYGPPGSQKTFVFEHLVAEFNRHELNREGSRNRAFLVRASVNIQPRDMIARICAEVGAYTGNSLQKCISGLRQRLRDTKTLIVLDEAQLCGISALEALREMHDTKPHIGILLGGSHGLKTFFDTRAAELEQWNSRLDEGVELSGVSDACAHAIIRTECPELEPDQVSMLIEGSRVRDVYSRDRTRTYLNMRRLFKNIKAVRQLSTEAEEATA